MKYDNEDDYEVRLASPSDIEIVTSWEDAGRAYSSAPHPAIIRRVNAWRIQMAVNNVDSVAAPDDQYRFTVIAPMAKGITYSGQRTWFKTEDEAKTWARKIYAKATAPNFDLCIVEAKSILSPEPQFPISERKLGG